eukprot:342146-Amphidinium_carterae.1
MHLRRSTVNARGYNSACNCPSPWSTRHVLEFYTPVAQSRRSHCMVRAESLLVAWQMSHKNAGTITSRSRRGPFMHHVVSTDSATECIPRRILGKVLQVLAAGWGRVFVTRLL